MSQLRFQVFAIQGHQKLAAFRALTFLYGNAFNKGGELSLNNMGVNRLDFSVGCNPGAEIPVGCVSCGKGYRSIPRFARRKHEHQHTGTQQDER